MPHAMTSQDFPGLLISVGQGGGGVLTSGGGGGSAITRLADLTDVQIIEPLIDGQFLKYIQSTGKWTNVDPQLASSSEVVGTALRSGDGFTTMFVIAHGFGSTPTNIFIEGNSSDTEDEFNFNVDGTNIYVVYDFPPPAGTNNLSFYYRVS